VRRADGPASQSQTARNAMSEPLAYIVSKGAEPLDIPSVNSTRVPRGAVEKTDLIAQIQARVAQCRRLAASVSDVKTVTALRKMADDGEATIARLRTETVHD